MFGFIFSYIDPAFAGMLLQIVLAVAVVGGTMVFAMKRKARALLKGKANNVSVSPVEVDKTVSEDGVVDALAE